MYAIVKTGGKQYRVTEGEWLLVERLPDADGATVALQPLLYVDAADVVDGEDLARVSVQATVLAHERGPKLRIVKFKPKRGYKRRNGHRQELTRIQITSIGLDGAPAPAPTATSSASAATASSAPAPTATSATASSAPAPTATSGGSDGA